MPHDAGVALLAASPSVLAFPSIGSLAHLKENLATDTLVLSDGNLAALQG